MMHILVKGSFVFLIATSAVPSTARVLKKTNYLLRGVHHHKVQQRVEQVQIRRLKGLMD